MIGNYLEELEEVHKSMLNQSGTIEEAAGIIKKSELVLTMGNGGSSSTAQHLAQGLCDVGIRAICLTDNVSLLTALSNDEDYEESLRWLVRLFSRKGECVTIVVISASGNSPNIVNAVEEAKRLHVRSIGLLGFGGGSVGSMATLSVILNSRDYGIIEDAHLSLCHIICRLIDGGI